MSFADEVRAEFTALPIKRSCCAHAAAQGLLFGASVAENKTVFLRLRRSESAKFALPLLKRQYGKEVLMTESGMCGHRFFDITFSSPSARKMLSSLVENGIGEFSCEECRSAFLRGLFLSAGTVNDPHKSFHLEFLLADRKRADRLSEYLCAIGYPPKVYERKNGFGIYYKDSTSIEDLITKMGAHHIVFEVINTKIEREIRNNENRATNCVARNIEKSILAAQKQVEAIAILMESGKFPQLEKPLQETARIRYQNPDATLEELASLHTPSISKSGLNHRLQRLIEAAECLPREGEK